MADGKTLTWRKFPRDTITNPALLFIAKKLPKERQHQVFTLITALYCSADDRGIVDLSDLAVFSYTCMMSEDDLVDLLYRFLDRQIIEELIIDEQTGYKIREWLDPYPGRMTAAEKQAAYRSRIAEKKPPEKRSFLGSKGRPPIPEAKPIDTSASGVSDEMETIYDEADELSDDEILALFLRLEKEDKTEAPIKIVEPPESAAAETPKSVTERYPDVTGVTQEKEPVTPVTGEKNEVTAENSSVTQRYPTPPKTEEIETEEREMRDRETERETDRGEIDTEKEDIENLEKKKRKRKDKTHTDRAGSPAKTPTGEILKEREAEEKETEVPPEREREPAQEPAAITEDVKKTKRQEAAQRSVRVFKILWKFFNDKNPMGFVDKDAERLACAQLADRIAMLEDEKNTAEIIACQFTNSFNRLLNKGGYFENMPCTPIMLLKPGNYSKVFYSVSKILHPKDQGGMHWAAELKKVMDNEL
ncbi:hypothetical protein E4N89_03285 [Treponema denticola]|uniref:hypothetical protein n=1 Tax=Treponema denticola TaxID=158 RepID=UPI003D94E286